MTVTVPRAKDEMLPPEEDDEDDDDEDELLLESFAGASLID